MVDDNKSDVLHDFYVGFVFDCPSDSRDKNYDDQCSQAEELLSCLCACLLACCLTHENLPAVFRCICKILFFGIEILWSIFV